MSLHYLQDNGMAEKVVQTAKNVIKKAIADKTYPYLVLLDHCKTPLSDQLGSPVATTEGTKNKDIHTNI